MEKKVYSDLPTEWNFTCKSFMYVCLNLLLKEDTKNWKKSCPDVHQSPLYWGEKIKFSKR